MRIVLIGPPGAGKGTQSVLLAEKLQIPHLSTGEILRASCAEKSDIGCQASQHMEQGHLVPDGIVQKIVFEELVQPACQNGYILDGFPRTVPQAEEFDKWLQGRDSSLTLVLEFRVTEEILLRRLDERGREDDDLDIIRQRMQQYNDLTRPLLDYYEGSGILHVIHGGEGAAEDVFATIEKILDELPQVKIKDKS